MRNSLVLHFIHNLWVCGCVLRSSSLRSLIESLHEHYVFVRVIRTSLPVSCGGEREP